MLGALQSALTLAGLPQGAIGFIEGIKRGSQLHDAPERPGGCADSRGGAGLIQAVVKNATVPVIETGGGIAMYMWDKSADFQMAERIIINAKASRPSVCNAIENLLVHQEIADAFLPGVFAALQKAGVEVRGDAICQRYGALPASEEDYRKEYLDYIIAVKVVSDVQQAVLHINEYGTKHSECIVTQNGSTTPAIFWTGWMRRRSMSMPLRALRMEKNSVLAQKSGLVRKSCMRGGRWGPKRAYKL